MTFKHIFLAGAAMAVTASFSSCVTDDKDAIGEAIVKVKAPNGETYTGTGLSTDIIESSIRAYVNGINKMLEDAGQTEPQA